VGFKASLKVGDVLVQFVPSKPQAHQLVATCRIVGFHASLLGQTETVNANNAPRRGGVSISKMGNGTTCAKPHKRAKSVDAI
jgi:hypothetical protein